jgi:hypothetical protein
MYAAEKKRGTAEALDSPVVKPTSVSVPPRPGKR